MQTNGSETGVGVQAKRLAATRFALAFDRILAVTLSLGVGIEHGFFTGCAACLGLWLVIDVWARASRMEDSARSVAD